MPCIEIGLFDLIDPSDAAWEERRAEHLVLLEMADRAGYARYHVAQTPRESSLSPAATAFLATAAQRTQHIELWPAAQVGEQLCGSTGEAGPVSPSHGYTSAMQNGGTSLELLAADGRYRSVRLPADGVPSEAASGGPRVAVLREVFVAESDRDAELVARGAFEDNPQSRQVLHAREPTRDPDARWTQLIATGAVLFGTPRRVGAMVRELLEANSCNYFVGSFAWGAMPAALAARSLALFAEHILRDDR